MNKADEGPRQAGWCPGGRGEEPQKPRLVGEADAEGLEQRLCVATHLPDSPHPSRAVCQGGRSAEATGLPRNLAGPFESGCWSRTSPTGQGRRDRKRRQRAG